MPQYNVTLADGATDKDLENAKKEAVDKGGKIVNEFTLIKGFTVNIPDDVVSTLKSNDKINVEVDGEMRTQ